MLLLRAEGLHSCPQMAWSQVRETVAEFLSPGDGLILFCGMSIGYEDPTVSYVRTGRASLDETVTSVNCSLPESRDHSTCDGEGYVLACIPIYDD
jgi:hypothetical protein